MWDGSFLFLGDQETGNQLSGNQLIGYQVLGIGDQLSGNSITP
jgi:hypothetical protein